MAIDPKDLSIHDDVLVETEVDGIPIGLPSFVTNVLDKELWLALRLPDPRLLRIKEGQRIHLTFDRGGALIVESEFVRRLGGSSRQGTEKSRVFAVRRPQGVDQVQRRPHVRVDLERDVRIKSFGALAADMVGAGRTVNIGAGGVQFTTEMPLMFGDQLRVALVLTARDITARDIVVAGGPVVRIDEIPAPVPTGSAASTDKPRMLTRVAVRFDKISEQDQERITCHILAAHRSRVADAARAATPPAGAATPPASAATSPAGAATPPAGTTEAAQPTANDVPPAEPEADSAAPQLPDGDTDAVDQPA
jgi:c-di-GMP-binding flagellar brake protein YcgR